MICEAKVTGREIRSQTSLIWLPEVELEESFRGLDCLHNGATVLVDRADGSTIACKFYDNDIVPDPCVLYEGKEEIPRYFVRPYQGCGEPEAREARAEAH